MIQQKIYYIIFICVITIITGSGCEDDLPTMSAPCEWQQNTTPLSVDSCFLRTTFPTGQYLIPPTVGKEIHRIAFDPTDDDLLYFTTWSREGLGGGPDSELYQLDLCENILTHLVTLEGFAGGDLKLNSRGDLLSGVFGDGMTIYNIYDQELLNEDVFNGRVIVSSSWASDSTICVSHAIELTNGQFANSWLLYFSNGIVLDTLTYSSGTASEARNGRIVFNTVNREGLNANLYVYDQVQEIAIDSLPSPRDAGLPFTLNNPQWLSDTEVILTTNNMIVVADFNAQTYRVVKEFSPNCDNLGIQSVAVVPSRSNELLYSLQHYFYNEDGEYRKRHEIVHLDISTGEEWVLWVE